MSHERMLNGDSEPSGRRCWDGLAARHRFGLTCACTWRTITTMPRSGRVRELFQETDQLHDGRWLWIRPTSKKDVESIELLLSTKRRPRPRRGRVSRRPLSGGMKPW